MFSVEDVLTRASIKLMELREKDPKGYARFTTGAEYSDMVERMQKMYREAEELREELRYQRDRVEEQAGLIAEFGRQLEEEGGSIYASDRVRYSAKIEATTAELRAVRKEVADRARQVFAEYGTTYPNVILPKDNAILNSVGGYPTSFFVDGEGRILTYPIAGAAVEEYEAAIDKLLAGEAIEAVPETGATANETGTHRVIVYDNEGNPIEGVVVQFCDDSTCSFEMTDADGVAVFKDREQKVWSVHLPVAPDGYAPDENEYKTLDTFSDVNIFLEKAK